MQENKNTTNGLQNNGVSRIFWIVTVFAFIIMFPLFWNIMAALTTIGKIVIGFLLGGALAILTGMLAESIISLVSLAKAKKLHRKHIVIFCIIIIGVVCIGFINNYIPEKIFKFFPALAGLFLLIIRFIVFLVNNKHNK
jgi:MFS family permease